MKKSIIIIFISLLALFTAACTPSENNEDPGNTPGNYIIVFETRYPGYTVASKTVEDGDLLELPEVPMRKGYSFTGWYTDISDASSKVETGTVIHNNTILYALWAKRTEHTVRFFFNTGEEDLTIYYTDGTPFDFPQDPERYGWFFRGWFTDELGKGDKISSYEDISGDTDLYAFWQIDESTNPIERHTVSFDLQGGTGTAEPVSGIPVGGRVTFPTITNGINILDGWYSKPNGKGKLYTSDSPIYYDITLYAFWMPPKYDIEFDVNGGDFDVAPILGVTHGNCVELPVPTRTGFFFMGWFDHSVKYTNLTPITKNVTLYAFWQMDHSFVPPITEQDPVASDGTYTSDSTETVNSDSTEPVDSGATAPVSSDATKTVDSGATETVNSDAGQ